MTTRTDTIADRVAQIARMRGVAITAEQLAGYCQVLAGHKVTMDEAWDAHMELWAEDDSRGMPAPAKMIDRVKAARRQQRAYQDQVNARAEDEIPEDEHRFGLACLDAIGAMASKKLRDEVRLMLGLRPLVEMGISLQEAEARQDTAARQMLGPDAMRRYMRAAHEARP